MEGQRDRAPGHWVEAGAGGWLTGVDLGELIALYFVLPGAAEGRSRRLAEAQEESLNPRAAPHV